MAEKLLEYGIAGGIMGVVMFVVVAPLIGMLRAELKASREERVSLCKTHHEYHEKSNAVLERLLESVNGLYSRINGGR